MTLKQVDAVKGLSTAGTSAGKQGVGVVIQLMSSMKEISVWMMNWVKLPSLTFYVQLV